MRKLHIFLCLVCIAVLFTFPLAFLGEARLKQKGTNMTEMRTDRQTDRTVSKNGDGTNLKGVNENEACLEVLA